MLVVSDTSPLRALQTLGLVGLLPRLYDRVLVTPGVVAELAVGTAQIAPFDLRAYPFFEVRAPAGGPLVERLRVELGRGEAEALALASELHADVVLIDEQKGRRAAKSLGLQTIGVLALLVRAKDDGLVAEVRPLVEELMRRINFRVDPRVLTEVLADAGEAGPP